MQQDGAPDGTPRRFRSGNATATVAAVNPLHPKKLLRTKWTAVHPVRRQKHFLVIRVHTPEPPDASIEWVELEAVLTRAVQRIDWRELKDPERWGQGWT